MTAQLIATIVIGAISILLVPFVVWLVKENTAHKVEMARMRMEFVTWQRLEQWRAETAVEFTKVRELIHEVALSVARLGPSTNHQG